MKRSHAQFIRIVTGLLLVIAILSISTLQSGLFGAGLARAQGEVAVVGVQPNVVPASQPAELFVSGANFQEGAEVVLEYVGALDTTYISPTALQASLPAGLTHGAYAITVVNPDDSQATLANALAILEPTMGLGVMPVQQDEEETPIPYERPLVVVQGYNLGGAETVSPGQEFTLVIKLKNNGEITAANLLITFTPGDFVPRVSGGVLALQELDSGEDRSIRQPMTATWDIAGKGVATAVMQVSYTDKNGIGYSSTFNLTVPVTPWSGRTITATPTPTGTPSPRPQLLIGGYNTDVETLQPGSRFNLSLQAQNVGNTTARRVTMILGGGSGSSVNPEGTPDLTGGVSGAGGDFGKFAPVASSNVQFLGDLEAGRSIDLQATLIVNAATEPGAYPMKISFTYTADGGNAVYTDDQIITLLVYSLPQVEVNFYADPGPIFAGQQSRLPIQVVNLGKKSTILGNMTISGEGAEYSNNTALVGGLDVGGYFPMDVNVIPMQPGPLEVQVQLSYRDDFNQSQVITKTLTVEVLEAPPVEPVPEGIPGEGGMPLPEAQPETFMQKVVRFFKGLVGLDSGQATPAAPGGMPGEGVPPGEGEPVSPGVSGPKG